MLNSLFLSRIPIFFVGLSTYFRIRENGDLLGLYLPLSILSFMITNGLESRSLLVPIVLLCLSFMTSINWNQCLERCISFCGKHSLEIYLAQHLATKYLMQNGIIDNLFCTYLAVIMFTILLSFLFVWINKTLIILKKGL